MKATAALGILSLVIGCCLIAVLAGKFLQNSTEETSSSVNWNDDYSLSAWVEGGQLWLSEKRIKRLIATGQYQDAHRILDSMVVPNDEWRDWVRMRKVEAYYQDDRFKEAHAELAAFQPSDSNYAVAMWYKGYLLLACKQSKPVEGLPFVQLAYELEPDNEVMIESLARTLMMTDETERGIELLRTVDTETARRIVEQHDARRPRD